MSKTKVTPAQAVVSVKVSQVDLDVIRAALNRKMAIAFDADEINTLVQIASIVRAAYTDTDAVLDRVHLIQFNKPQYSYLRKMMSDETDALKKLNFLLRHEYLITFTKDITAPTPVNEEVSNG